MPRLTRALCAPPAQRTRHVTCLEAPHLPRAPSSHHALHPSAPPLAALLRPEHALAVAPRRAAVLAGALMERVEPCAAQRDAGRGAHGVSAARAARAPCAHVPVKRAKAASALAREKLRARRVALGVEGGYGARALASQHGHFANDALALAILDDASRACEFVSVISMVVDSSSSSSSLDTRVFLVHFLVLIIVIVSAEKLETIFFFFHRDANRDSGAE